MLQLHEPSRKEDVEKTDHAIFELKVRERAPTASALPTRETGALKRA